MAVNTAPIFIKTPQIGRARLTAGNTMRDGSGTANMADVFTATTDGSAPMRIIFTASPATAAASTAKVGRVYHTDNAGANPRLLAEVPIAAATPSTSAIGATATYTFPDGFFMGSGEKIKVDVSIGNSTNDQVDVVCYGGNYS